MQKVYTVPCVGNVPKARCPGAAPPQVRVPARLRRQAALGRGRAGLRGPAEQGRVHAEDAVPGLRAGPVPRQLGWKPSKEKSFASVIRMYKYTEKHQETFQYAFKNDFIPQPQDEVLTSCTRVQKIPLRVPPGAAAFRENVPNVKCTRS